MVHYHRAALIALYYCFFILLPTTNRLAQSFSSPIMTLRRSIRLLSKLNDGSGNTKKLTKPVVTNRTKTTRPSSSSSNGSFPKAGEKITVQKKSNNSSSSSKKKISTTTKKMKGSSKKKSKTRTTAPTLPRTREQELLSNDENSVTAVVGIDEAGRGPLAGPVVAAAVIQFPSSTNDKYPVIEGVTDSKKITKEDQRQELYDQLVACPSIHFAVAIVDAACIDEINILQATLKAMRLAACGVLGLKEDTSIRYESQSSVDHTGCYVVQKEIADKSNSDNGAQMVTKNSAYALIDGNRIPSDLPCLGEAIVKGDGREYIIGAASILAKVTRDNLMREYDQKYPEYLLQQHKGYPTAKHMALVHKYGPSPIHRLTFAPIKHMDISSYTKQEEN